MYSPLITRLHLVQILRTSHAYTSISTYNFRNLAYQEDALLDRFVELHISQKSKALLDEWEEKADIYLKQKQSGVKISDIEKAFNDAEQVSHALHLELWKTVESLFWGLWDPAAQAKQ